MSSDAHASGRKTHNVERSSKGSIHSCRETGNTTRPVPVPVPSNLLGRCLGGEARVQPLAASVACGACNPLLRRLGLQGFIAIPSGSSPVQECSILVRGIFVCGIIAIEYSFTHLDFSVFL